MTEAEYADIGRSTVTFFNMLRRVTAAAPPPPPPPPQPERAPDWNEISAAVEREVMKTRYEHPEFKRKQVVDYVRALHPSWKTTGDCVSWYVNKYKQNPRLWKFLRPNERPEH